MPADWEAGAATSEDDAASEMAEPICFSESFGCLEGEGEGGGDDEDDAADCCCSEVSKDDSEEATVRTKDELAETDWELGSEEVGSSYASASGGSCRPIKGDAKQSGRGPTGWEVASKRSCSKSRTSMERGSVRWPACACACAAA